MTAIHSLADLVRVTSVPKNEQVWTADEVTALLRRLANELPGSWRTDDGYKLARLDAAQLLRNVALDVVRHGWIDPNASELIKPLPGASVERLTALARRLVALDDSNDADGVTDRRTITLDQICRQARDALGEESP